MELFFFFGGGGGFGVLGFLGFRVCGGGGGVRVPSLGLGLCGI